MFAPILIISFTALVVWALWSLARPRAAFVIRITQGVPRVTHGTVTAAFLHEVRDACTRHAVDAAEVRGVVKGGHIALTFSEGVPAVCQQQLRNLWFLQGRSAR